MPRDGGTHLSHYTYQFMYNHAKALFTEIGAQGKRINRQKTPCIMVREYIYLILYAGDD